MGAMDATRVHIVHHSIRMETIGHIVAPSIGATAKRLSLGRTELLSPQGAAATANKNTGHLIKVARSFSAALFLGWWLSWALGRLGFPHIHRRYHLLPCC